MLLTDIFAGDLHGNSAGRRENTVNWSNQTGALAFPGPPLGTEFGSSAQNYDIAGQFGIVQGSAPFAIFIAIGHALKANALHHVEFNDEWRFLLPGFRRGWHYAL